MSNAAVMLCAGRATRMRGAVADKVLAPLAGRPVLEYSVRAFLDSKVASHFVFVVRDAAQLKAIIKLLKKIRVAPGRVSFTLGGQERQDSVYHGLRATPAASKDVFIHDCARPLVVPAILRKLRAAVERDGAAVLAHRVTDTIKQVSPGARGGRNLPLRDLPRDTLWAMETPQALARGLALKAYEKVRAKKLRVTDDVAAAALLGHPVTLVENSSPNPKLTHPEDFAYVGLLLKRRAKS